MKKLCNRLFNQMSNEQVENLTSLVNETLATGMSHPKSKFFTPVDLWNIQRLGKYTLQKRRFF